MIQVGKYCYFPDAPWLLNEAGAVVPTSCSVASYVPAEAVAFFISCPLFRAWGDEWGNVDVATMIRLPGYLNTNYAVIAQLASAGNNFNPRSNCLESTGMYLRVPNIGREFYWLIQGAPSCLNVGVNVSIALHGYELP